MLPSAKGSPARHPLQKRIGPFASRYSPLSAGGHLCQSSAIPAYSPYTTTCKAISASVVPTVMSQTDVKDAKAAGCLGKLLLAGSFWWFSEICRRLWRFGGWDANLRPPQLRKYRRPRVAQSDQRCLLQRGKTLAMLIRQHFDKDRGALWRPCDVPGKALWYRQLVRKRSGVPHTLELWKAGRIHA